MKTSICLTALTLAAVVLGGCNGNEGRVSHRSITGNLTPEMRGLSMRPVDAHNNFALAANENLRMLSDDLARMFYTDNPSRLTPFPVADLSGQPR